MNDSYLTRPEVKARAKQQLYQPNVYKNMVIANVLPWLIKVVFMILTVLALMTLAKTLPALTGSSANSTASLQQIYRSAMDTGTSDQKRTLIASLISLWFTQGIAFTALDVYRGKTTTVQPVHAIFRLFNGQYFFGILLVGILVQVLAQLGYYLLIIPGILATYGLAMSYYTYYDGKEAGSFSAFAALGQSWRVMRGFKLDLFVFQLSLLGWYLLENVTFHLFDLLIDPYLQVANAGFYDNVRRYQDGVAADTPM